MGNKIISLKNIFLIFFITANLVYCSDAFSFVRGGRNFMDEDRIPQPKLLYPNRDTADITGKITLDFKWSSHERARGFRKYYDFRLYEGNQMVESGLIFKQEVDPENYSISIPADKFNDGETYTWSLRQVYSPSNKSDRANQTFRVIKNSK